MRIRMMPPRVTKRVGETIPAEGSSTSGEGEGLGLGLGTAEGEGLALGEGLGEELTHELGGAVPQETARLLSR